MHEEYKAIVDAGFLLQIDDPHLATHYVSRPELSVEQVRRWAEVRVEALNHALRGLPRERIRWHTCYGINIGPRVHDLELKHFVDVMLKIRAGAYSFEAANPRHEHEWRVWEQVKLPEGALLIPGTITQSTVLVEHPELVADRIGRFARAVGRENVIAGADCGFATFAGSTEIHPSVVWAKFEALVRRGAHRDEAALGPELTMAEASRRAEALRSDDIGWRVLPMRGASIKVLRHDQETGGSTALVRFEAGTRFPAHNHPAGEEIFVVEGDLLVGGERLKAGDYLYTPPDGKHAASSEGGCVFLVTLPKPVEFLER